MEGKRQNFFGKVTALAKVWITTLLTSTVSRKQAERPRDERGRFLARTAQPPSETTGLHTPPVSQLSSTPLLSLEPSPSSSAAPSLSSLVALESEPASPASDPARVPFPSSPSAQLTVDTPRVASTSIAPPVATSSPARKGSLPERPLPSLASLIRNSESPAMTNPDSNADLRAARRALADTVKDFDDEGRPCSEEEWRYKFMRATRDVTSKQRAALWADSLAFKGEAYNWLLAQRKDQTNKDLVDDWTTLQPLIEARWPTPVPDQDAYEEAQRAQFNSSFMDVPAWSAILCDPTNSERPQQQWAMQHRARGMACDSTDRDRVLHTLNFSVPPFVVPLLPKGRNYAKDFELLCKHLGELSNRDLYDSWRDRALLDSIGSLSLSHPPSSTSLSPRSRSPAPPAATRVASTPKTLSVTPATPKRGPQVSFGDVPPAAAAPAVPPPIPPPAFSSLARQTPPHMPSTPAPTPAPPVVPLGRPTVPNTPDDQARHRALVLEYDQKFGARRPTPEEHYPLTPGSLMPGPGVCSRCGIGMHGSVECPNAPMDERERFMRAVILNPRASSRRQGRAGTVPGTPTPAPRPRDTFQLETETEDAGWETDYYNSENEDGVGEGVGGGAGFQFRTVFFFKYIIELYELHDTNEQREVPFQVRALLRNEDNMREHPVRATIDGGAMLCVLDRTYWGTVEADLGPLAKSNIICRMANGQCEKSAGRGNAYLGVASHWLPITFEVLESRGAFEILLGKTWLRDSGAVQIFEGDRLTITGPQGPIELANEYPLFETSNNTPEPKARQRPAPEPERKEVESKPEDNKPSESIPARRSRRLAKLDPPALEYSNNPFWVDEMALERMERALGMSTHDHDDAETEEAVPVAQVLRDTERVVEETEDEFLERMWQHASIWREEKTQRKILLTGIAQDTLVDHLMKIIRRAQRARERAKGPINIQMLNGRNPEDRHPSAQRRVNTPPFADSQRRQDPFELNRVAEIVTKVKIGADLTQEQRQRAEDLVREFADVFALSLSEVIPVDFIQHRLDIPEGVSFPRQAGQKRLTEPQRKWLYKVLDDMEAAKIVAKVPQDEVAAVSPTNVVPKPGGAELPSLDALRRMANEQCRLHNLPIMWPEVEGAPAEEGRVPGEPKFRVVHNYAAVNRHTQVRPFPMGDLAAMQRKVAGHRWISVMDFMAGFHAIPMAPESVPYTGFHVDGRGYYVYLRMPFGLTGAPTTFCEAISAAMHDLIGTELEVWMDDVAAPCDDFDVGLGSLRNIFLKCRAHGLSLSPAKTVLFMTEARFAGARCSKEGVRPDLSKVEAILKWPEPKSALEVLSFLGSVGSYRSKIKDYARIAQPLSDLTRDVRPPQVQNKRNAYKNALKDSRVTLDEEARRAFIKLKTILTSDPVTRAPVYDGRPFTVTTDGSKFGFGAVLSQEWEELDSTGMARKVMYPVAFASKRTSRTEERYIPFLLEFAALKFGLDEFDSIIHGQAIELETDCKALADLLNNDKLNSTHERWRESIIARNIVAVRHKPGVENKVADGLSRMYEHRADEEAPGREDTVDPGWETRQGIINDVYHLIADDPTAELIKRFEKDPFFSDILMHILFDSGDSSKLTHDQLRAQRRLAHRAEGFVVEDGKLWAIGGRHSNSTHKVECIPSCETQELALSVHCAGGHFGRDAGVLALQKAYYWPGLRRDMTNAVITCPRCKNFGPRLLSAQLQPITRARPFDLIVGDYVSLPAGHGGFKCVLVLVDVYSRFIFATPLRGPGTGKTTVNALEKLSDGLLTPQSFMADGGSHFDCAEVHDWARSRNVQPLKTPPYAPWANGLAEGSIKLVIGRLKRLCTPTVGESPEEDADASTTPASWPKHLATAVSQLNDRALASLGGYSPRELLTGQLKAERRYQLSHPITESTSEEVEVNLALTYALRQDGFAQALKHANRRKRQFDKHIKPVSFQVGDLVQRYDARWDETHAAERKLAPRWSGPLRVRSRATNSYELEDLHGKLFTSAAHARLLRPFVPRPNTPLAAYADGLQQARAQNMAATRPSEPVEASSLPATPRPESRFPLEREDNTQPK
ncbi:Retrovirus-related Pol polyprotein from transposon opus [Ceratobasidium sp. AG-Ba]|nr:Retrovirus-related Pol polyprotein from transposon opus [Ceratobasidium sp. AG-Ba]